MRTSMSVESVMSNSVSTCHVDDTAGRAAELMWNNDVGFLPVVGDDNRVVATITDRDLCMAAYTQGRPLSEIPVSSAMSKHVVYVRPAAKLEDAEQLMRERQIHRLPVIDAEGRAVGVVSLADLARSCEHKGGASPQDVVRAMMGITRATNEVARAAARAAE